MKRCAFAKPDAVDDRGVIEFVRDDRVFGLHQRLEHAAVGVETRAVKDRVVQAQKGRDLRLQLAVHFLRAADEPHATTCRSPSGPAPVWPPRSVRDVRPVRGSCWRRNSARRPAAPDRRALRRLNDPFGFIQPGLADRGQLGGQKVLIFAVHRRKEIIATGPAAR